MTKLEQYLVRKWEFWPQWLIHFPTAVFYFVMGLRARNFLFFTNISNDYKDCNIENSSKHFVYSKLQQAYFPITHLIKQVDKSDISLASFKDLSYPIIAKPNIGKRGLAANLLFSDNDLMNYAKNANYDILLQEFIDYSNECGIFYIRMPEDEQGRITSIGLKKLVAVTGDGKLNLNQLLTLSDITLSDANTLANQYDLNTTVLNKGQELVIEPIGSHNRGTMISSGDHLITEQLLQVIEDSLQGLELYYGRLDIKYQNWKDLLKGNFKIIEVNTITSEPLSIYDHSIPMLKKYKIFYGHIKSMYLISQQLKKKGRKRLSTSEFIKYIKSYDTHLKSITTAQIKS